MTDAAEGFMRRRRWQHDAKRRYYTADIVRDLFGQWCVVVAWGGLDTRRGRLVTYPVDSNSAAHARMAATAKRRNARGYRVAGSGYKNSVH